MSTSMFARARGRNLIIQGIPEGENELTAIQNIMSTIGATDEPLESKRIKRLGIAAPDKTRAVLVEVESVEKRNKLVTQARECTAPTMKDIRLKKDLHPAVRNEWKRLFTAKETESRKPENAGKVILLDIRKKQLTCDGTIIDSWNPVF